MNIIRTIDRILWASRIGSLTSPAHWGLCSHCGQTSPWVTRTQNGEYCCTRCDHDSSDHANN